MGDTKRIMFKESSKKKHCTAQIFTVTRTADDSNGNNASLASHGIETTGPPHIQTLRMFRLAHRLPFLEVAMATKICSPPDWLSESELGYFLSVFCLFNLLAEN